MLVISDTSPLNYLVLVGVEEILPELFQAITIPATVAEELDREGTPAEVRTWLRQGLRG